MQLEDGGSGTHGMIMEHGEPIYSSLLCKIGDNQNRSHQNKEYETFKKDVLKAKQYL